MRAKLIGGIIVIIAALTCAPASCIFIESAKRNLGLSPSLQEFESFSSARISRVAITYVYSPKDFLAQEIKFVLRDAEVIKRLQKLFKIKSISAYTVGVEPKIVFHVFNEKNRYDGWIIDFKEKRKLLFAHDNWSASQSCVVILEDDSFYDAVFELVCENNKRLFPESAESDVCLCF